MDEEEQPVVSVGSSALRLWDEESQSYSKAEVLEVKRKKKAKHNSCFKYKLKLGKSGEIVETRLLNLKYKLRDKKDKKDKKRESDIPPLLNTPGIIMPMAGNKQRQREHMKTIDVSNICAPMVGGSELAFRLLCRRYNCTLAYTPMISSARFPLEERYRDEEFQVTPEDRPLVAHFSSNEPQHLLQSALLVQDRCDAIDLNLGCPQRIAHAGHFGSYLLGIEDRPLILAIVKAVADAVHVPVFVKIRLLNSVPETIELVNQLRDAGASLVCIHGRYRVNLVGRTGAGARDGAAHLDQIREVRKAVRAYSDTCLFFSFLFLSCL
jgi:tRNA-dihydrouridine synthase 1